MHTFPAARVLTATAVLFLMAIGVHVAAQGQPPPAGRGGAPAEPQGRGGGGGRGQTYPQFQRPLADRAVLERGAQLYAIRCAGCHGRDLRGGDLGGPNLLRSPVVLVDKNGESIGVVIQSGRQTPGMPGMPALSLPPEDTHAIVEFIHSVMAQAGRQGRPPTGEKPQVLDILVGDIEAGRRYFNARCSSCHSVTGDLQGIGTRVADPKELQNLWVSGGGGGRGGPSTSPGASGTGRSRAVRVTVTPRGEAPVEGRLVRMDDFIVTLMQDDGTRRMFRRTGDEPKVETKDPLDGHRALLPGYTDKDMHDVTAFLAAIK